VRILLVQPPLDAGSEAAPPLGLCTLAAHLKRRGDEVLVCDLDLEVKTKLRATGATYLEHCADVLADFAPDVVGLTSMFNNSLQAERLIRLARRRAPDLSIVAGGPHFGSLGGHALQRIGDLDFVVRGEGETSFSLLLDALASGTPVETIPRLCGRDAAGAIWENPNAPLIKMDAGPTWRALGDSVDLARYAATIPGGSPRRIVYIEAGRGCPFACTFCATAPFWERRFRVKPVGVLVEEIRDLHERFGYDSFILVHDLLTVDQRFISRFCDAMLEARLPVEWMANSRTDIRMRQILPKMKAAGCWKLFFGIESASVDVQRAIDKDLRMEDVVQTLDELAELGIASTCSFVIGFPGESAEDISATIDMAARAKLLGAETVQVHRLRLWPPSPLSRSGIHAVFDLESLRIEYPFVPVPEEDAREIAADRQFFSGYFAPVTIAGTPEEISQIEMFFHHTLAVAPFTIGALARMAGPQLIPSFKETLSASGPIVRESLSWDIGIHYANWAVLEPLLRRWVEKLGVLQEWQRQLVYGLMRYEAARLQFITERRGDAVSDAFASGDDWIALDTTADFVCLARLLSTGEALDPVLLQDGGVLVTHEGGDQFAAYQLSLEQRASMAGASRTSTGFVSP